MFKRFHVQMTFFCSLIISIVIIIITIAYVSISESSMESINYSNFVTNSNSAISYIREQSVISAEWIATTEQNNQMILSIYDNFKPISITSLRLNDHQITLIDTIKEESREKYGLDLDVSSNNVRIVSQESFRLVEESGSYYATTAIIPKDKGTLCMVIYQPLSIHRPSIIRQRYLFFAIDAAAILVLSLFAWFFTGKMIAPLEKSRKRQAQFIASASHELRTPLAVMLSSLSAMRKGNPEESKRFADNIQSEGNRMSRLIDDMLSLANADNHNWSIQKEPIELDTLLLNVYEMYQPLVKKNEQLLSITLPDDMIPTCYCDKLRIQQVLSILIDNAMSYTPVGGKIKLSISYHGSKIELHVEDNGPGIPLENREHIFQRFYRIDKSHNKKDHFGLGLSIAKEIVKLHKGKIYVTAGTQGGALFVIDLPV